jgi:hypothetical protein
MQMYVLDVNRQPIRCNDYEVYGRWMQENYRVRLTEIDGIKISTVFLGLDHRFANTSDPILWETMIFGGPHDQYQDRYTSEAEAITGHEKAVALATAPVSVEQD